MSTPFEIESFEGRGLDQFSAFDRHLLPDLESIARWLRYRVFESGGTL